MEGRACARVGRSREGSSAFLSSSVFYSRNHALVSINITKMGTIMLRGE